MARIFRGWTELKVFAFGKVLLVYVLRTNGCFSPFFLRRNPHTRSLPPPPQCTPPIFLAAKMTPVRLRTREEEKISFRIPRRILFAAGECWAGEKRGGGEENEVKNHCWYRFVNMLRRSLIALLHLFRISCFYQEGTIFIALLALLPPPPL